MTLAISTRGYHILVTKLTVYENLNQMETDGDLETLT